MTSRPKPITPYQRLLRVARTFASKVAGARRVSMFMYPKEKLGAGYALDDLYQRAMAAQQLGWDVMLIAKDDGLHVHYLERRPEAPSEFWS